MSKTIDEKREENVRQFIINAKTEFKKFIPRDTITDIEVTDCVENDGSYTVTGALGATSPTGKLKTFGYSAIVDIDADGKCSLAKLQLSE